MTKTPVQFRRGLTLLELLVVVAILAVLGGAMLIAYEGLEERARKAHNGYTSAAINRALETYKRLNGQYPHEWDSLLAGDSSANPFTGAALIDRLNPGIANRLNVVALTPEEVTSLRNAGITTVRDLDQWIFATNQYDNDFDLSNDHVRLPNRIFDDAR